MPGTGADILIDYTTDDFAQVMAKDNGGADVILDIARRKYLPGNIAATRKGRLRGLIGAAGRGEGRTEQ